MHEQVLDRAKVDGLSPIYSVCTSLARQRLRDERLPKHERGPSKVKTDAE